MRDPFSTGPSAVGSVNISYSKKNGTVLRVGPETVVFPGDDAESHWAACEFARMAEQVTDFYRSGLDSVFKNRVTRLDDQIDYMEFRYFVPKMIKALTEQGRI